MGDLAGMRAESKNPFAAKACCFHKFVLFLEILQGIACMRRNVCSLRSLGPEAASVMEVGIGNRQGNFITPKESFHAQSDQEQLTFEQRESQL